jgi:hypothetical protein
MADLFYRWGKGKYLRNENGVKRYAENGLSDLLVRTTKRSAKYRETNENLLVEKANLRMRGAELAEQPMLDGSEYFSVRRRIRINTAIIVASVAAGILFSYLSISAFLNETANVSGWVAVLASLIFAVVLVGGGLIVTERLIESIIPRRSFRAESRGGESPKAVAWLWALLLVAIEVAIFSLADVRAAQFAATEGRGALYLGFVVFAMIMPVVAGTIRWDAMRFVDIFETTQAFRGTEDRLAQIDSLLQQNGEFESNYYKIKLLETWDDINEFKTHKDNYNEKKGIVESIDGHFVQSFDQFQAEASKRYDSDIRDLTSKSMRRLDATPATPKGGGKLDAFSMRPSDAPKVPASEDGKPRMTARPVR